ncbi:hypothetical protein [Nocardioides ultimimeridianus]
MTGSPRARWPYVGPRSVQRSGSNYCPSQHWDYYRQRFERDRGLKIDFVLGSPAFADRVTGAFVDRDERNPAIGTGSPSDHAPVVVDLTD